MAVSKRWALGVGLALVLLAAAGLSILMRHSSDVARLPAVPAGSAAAPVVASTTPRSAGAAPSSQVPSAEQPVSQTPLAEPPHFDVVRVEPSGDTVVAGKAAPNAKVALLSEGIVAAETVADANGSFVVLPPSLTPGVHALSLRQTQANGVASTSTQSVTIAVPERGKGSVVVALAEPGQATKVLSAPEASKGSDAPKGPEAQKTPDHSQTTIASSTAVEPAVTNAPSSGTSAGDRSRGKPTPPSPANASARAADPAVAVRAVDLENGDGFHASGIAKPGTTLRLYLNDAHIADVVADSAGQWTVTIRKGLSGGHYVVRADAERPADAQRTASTVTARVEVPFDVPMASAAGSNAGPKPPSVSTATTPVSSASASPPDAGKVQRPTITADAGNAVIEEIQTARVVTGDSLWAISLTRLGHAERYTQIYSANEKQIRDPNLIYPGQVFVLPR